MNSKQKGPFVETLNTTRKPRQCEKAKVPANRHLKGLLKKGERVPSQKKERKDWEEKIHHFVKLSSGSGQGNAEEKTCRLKKDKKKRAPAKGHMEESKEGNFPGCPRTNSGKMLSQDRLEGGGGIQQEKPSHHR